MIDFSMFPVSALVVLSFTLGLGLGFGYFAALRATVGLVLGGGGMIRALVLTLGRLAVLVAGFLVAVQAGWAPLLAACAGVMLAKRLMLRRLGQVAP